MLNDTTHTVNKIQIMGNCKKTIPGTTRKQKERKDLRNISHYYTK